MTHIDQLRLIYKEIVLGCSPGKQCFFKHPSEIDNIELLSQKEKLYQKYLDHGIPSEEERLKEIISQELWSLQKEDDIVSLRLSISDNEKNIHSVIIQQQAAIRKMIDQDKNKLLMLLFERSQYLGTTAEELSIKDINTYMYLILCFKDRECKERFFSSWDEIESLENEKISEFNQEYNQLMEKFSDKAIRQLSVLPFFLNNFSYCKDNISLFLNKPIVELTNFQSFLFSYGQRNLSILNQSEGAPPELIGDVKIDDILTWYDQQYSLKLREKLQNKCN